MDDIDKLLGESAESLITTGEHMPLVIVIDDDATQRTSIQFALSKKYSVDVYSSGAEGVAALKPTWACVILDIKMPDRDGFWTYRAIRREDADIPIVFNSAYQDLEDPFVIMNEYRPFGYLTKSGDITELLRMVDKAVEFREGSHSKKDLMQQLRKLRGEMATLRKEKGW
ncbi:MAG: response regulator [Myxococcota bacterium]|nr:response regulator [Myxococcota bacterium]